MAPKRLPVLFISHGAPSLPLDPGATGALWQTLARQLPTPRAILVISAHWDTDPVRVSSVERPPTIHDFSGFPRELYDLHYPAPGAPDLAHRVAQLLTQAQIPIQIDAQRGLDHGAWVPLMFLRPAADIPVTQLSLQARRDPAWHYRIGQTLATLRDEGVLIMASGSASHNLREVFSGVHHTPPAWLTSFMQWLVKSVAARDIDSMLKYRTQAPEAIRNHPTDEHLLPLFVALGATVDDSVEHFAPEITFGALTMDAWRWSAS